MAVLTACWKLWATVVTDVDAVPTAVVVIESTAACIFSWSSGQLVSGVLSKLYFLKQALLTF